MINYISKNNSVVLYWDLPEGFKKGDLFKISNEKGLIAETEKCHFEVSGLSANCEYCFTVDGAGMSEKVTCATRPESRIINITDFGAVGDGKTLNTKAIQAAIDSCKEGETVYIPEGDFMTGSLFLHSDMELYLGKGAVLHGTTNVHDYEPKIKSRFEGIEMMCYASLINVGTLDHDNITCKNVRICGEGTVCGGGKPLAEEVIRVETLLMQDYIASLGDSVKECENSVTIQGRVRPRLINVSSAENVTVCNVGIENGASWNLHMIYSKNIVTYGCTFKSDGVWNGDGWDPDSSSNCTLFGCEFCTGDDAVAIKSGKNPEGNVINRPCEHIRIFDCVSRYGHGFTVGSEMSGGVNDVCIWNCDLGDSVFGIEIKATKKRGGYVRNVCVRNTRTCRVLMHSVGYNDDGIAAPTVPIFEDCSFEDLEITARRKGMDGEIIDCQAVELAGFDEPGHFIKNVRFKNISIDSGKSKKQAIYLQCCEGISFENINCK